MLERFEIRVRPCFNKIPINNVSLQHYYANINSKIKQQQKTNLSFHNKNKLKIKEQTILSKNFVRYNLK